MPLKKYAYLFLSISVVDILRVRASEITEVIFCSLALDQKHEQLIGSIKGAGRVKGITENPEAMHSITAGPELIGGQARGD